VPVALTSPSEEGQYCGTLLPRHDSKCKSQSLLAHAMRIVGKAVLPGLTLLLAKARQEGISCPLARYRPRILTAPGS